MSIKSEDWLWLRDAGYRNCCFISYPRLQSRHVSDFARQLKRGIEEELDLWIPDPRAFLDESHILPGAVWPETLRDNLCRSICMLAILVPRYVEPAHEWCGREWAAMNHLGSIRFPNTDVKPIIPIFFRKFSLPAPFDSLQGYDFSHPATSTVNSWRTEDFRRLVHNIVADVARLGTEIRRNACVHSPGQCQFPKESAFLAAAPPNPLAFPLRG